MMPAIQYVSVSRKVGRCLTRRLPQAFILHISEPKWIPSAQEGPKVYGTVCLGIADRVAPSVPSLAESCLSACVSPPSFNASLAMEHRAPFVVGEATPFYLASRKACMNMRKMVSTQISFFDEVERSAVVRSFFFCAFVKSSFGVLPSCPKYATRCKTASKPLQNRLTSVLRDLCHGAHRCRRSPLSSFDVVVPKCYFPDSGHQADRARPGAGEEGIQRVPDEGSCTQRVLGVDYGGKQ